jgi:hypothetical protein
MAASLTPCFSNRGMALCSWTSCPLQKGHQSADRKKRRTVPFLPFKVSRVCTLPNWSCTEKAGAFWPTASPIDIGCTEATRIVSPSSVPRTVTLSPRWAVTDPCGSRPYITLLVSSYRVSFAPGTFLVHSEDSLNASSALQLLDTIVPDHAPGVFPGFVAGIPELPCPAIAKGIKEKRASRQIKIRFVAELVLVRRINTKPSLYFKTLSYCTPDSFDTQGLRPKSSIVLPRANPHIRSLPPRVSSPGHKNFSVLCCGRHFACVVVNNSPAFRKTLEY